MVAGVEGNFAWPKTAQVVPFDGMDFILRPAEADRRATIAFNAGAHGLDTKQGQARIFKLATAFSWSDGNSLEITNWASGSFPIGIGKWHGSIVRDFLAADDLPHSSAQEAWVALALFREGLASKNVFYSFLSFFKVIASIHRDGRRRAIWIREKLDVLDADEAVNRRDELRTGALDVADYLFDEGRNAIAHAEKDIFINPDEPVDYERISRDTPIIRNLAEIAIEEKYKLLRRRTRYQTKGLDVGGLKEAIGGELWKMLLEKSPKVEGKNLELPDTVSIVARRDASVHPFEDMRFGAIGPDDIGIRFLLSSSDETVQFIFRLNLEKEELLFEPLQDMGLARETESPDAIDRAIKFLKFQYCILSNGRVEIWDEKTEALIGRTSPYLPLNMMVNPEGFNGQIAELEARKADLMGS